MAAIARCIGSGRGPSRALVVLSALAWCSIAPRSEPIRTDQAQPQAEHVGQRRVRRPGGRLLLPQVEVAAGQGVQNGRIGHVGTIGKPARRRHIAPQHGLLCIAQRGCFPAMLPAWNTTREQNLMAETGADKATVVIKKYANRRLYNTATSSYVTLDHLCQMVKDGVEFAVYDAKSGEDITRSVLTQIIVEEEGKGQNLLPINFLRQLISYYGDNLQFLVPRYLEHTMEYFANNQEQMRNYMRDTFGGMFPFGRFEDLGKQNIAFFERALKMFAPFQGEQRDSDRSEPAANPGTEATALADLKSQLDVLQKRIDSMSRQKSEKAK
jgi:polyhydroxyalkanoate synthesis repressor PhaR